MTIKWSKESDSVFHLLEEAPSYTVANFPAGWNPIGRVEQGRSRKIFSLFWYAVLYGSPSRTGHSFTKEDALDWLEKQYVEDEGVLGCPNLKCNNGKVTVSNGREYVTKECPMCKGKVGN